MPLHHANRRSNSLVDSFHCCLSVSVAAGPFHLAQLAAGAALTSFPAWKMEVMGLAIGVWIWLIIGFAEPGEEALLLRLLLGSVFSKLDVLKILIFDCLWSVESVGVEGGPAQVEIA